MRSSQILHVCLGLAFGLSLSQGACKKNEKKSNPKPTGAPIGNPTPTPDPVPDDGTDIGNPAVKQNTEAVQTFTSKVANKTWQLCRQWSATKSELVVTVMQDANDSYTSTRTTYRSGDCSGSGDNQNQTVQTGKYVIDGSPSPDTWTYQIKVEDTTTHYAIVGLREGKLYFGNYDSRDGLSEANRPTDLDMAEGYVDKALGKEGLSTRYKK